MRGEYVLTALESGSVKNIMQKEYTDEERDEIALFREKYGEKSEDDLTDEDLVEIDKFYNKFPELDVLEVSELDVLDEDEDEELVDDDDEELVDDDDEELVDDDLADKVDELA